MSLGELWQLSSSSLILLSVFAIAISYFPLSSPLLKLFNVLFCRLSMLLVLALPFLVSGLLSLNNFWSFSLAGFLLLKGRIYLLSGEGKIFFGSGLLN